MKIVAIGIHPDDVELGCGGTVILAADQGHDVTVVDLSEGASSSNGTVEERRSEASAAAKVMGIEARVNLELPDTAIQSEDPEQLARVVACIRNVRPDLALIPSSDDPHPDHASGGELLRRALYFAGVHGYAVAASGEQAHRTRNVLVYPGRSEMRADAVVDITSTFERKMKAIEAHASQFGGGTSSRPTVLNASDFLPFVEARCRVYGRQIDVRYGEPFRLLSPLSLSSFDVFRA